MICNRFKVWQASLALIVAASLIGCGSSNTQGTTTAVPGQTTAVAPAGMAAPGKPGMPAGQGSAPGAGHMNMANMQMSAPQGMAGPPGSPTAPASPNMGAHMSPGLPPGANSNSSPNMDTSKMMAHAGPGGMAAPPGGMAAPPNGAPPGGMAAPPGGAHTSPPGGAGMAAPPGGMAAPPGGAHTSPPGGAGMAAPPGGQANAPGMAAPGGANGPNPAMAQMRGQNGAMPGQPGGPGSPAGNLTPGSVEDILYRFCVAIADGDTAAAGEFVSPKAKGLIGQIRDGELSEEKLEEVTNAISPVNELQPNPSQTNTKRSLRNKKNQVITFTVKKDKDDEYKITELSISKPKKGGQGGGGQGGQNSF